jgi:RHS repeat-associated protein
MPPPLDVFPLAAAPQGAWGRRYVRGGKTASGGLRNYNGFRVFEKPRGTRVFGDLRPKPRRDFEMQARMYLPSWGRFASPDPARDQHFEQTQSWNIYSYVQNNPVMNTDPTGMWSSGILGGYLLNVHKNIIKDAFKGEGFSGSFVKAVWKADYQFDKKSQGEPRLHSNIPKDTPAGAPSEMATREGGARNAQDRSTYLDKAAESYVNGDMKSAADNFAQASHPNADGPSHQWTPTPEGAAEYVTSGHILTDFPSTAKDGKGKFQQSVEIVKADVKEFKAKIDNVIERQLKELLNTPVAK